MILPKDFIVEGFPGSNGNKWRGKWKSEGNYKCFRKFCLHKDYKKAAPIIDDSLVYANTVLSYGNQTYTSKVLKGIDVHKMSLKFLAHM